MQMIRGLRIKLQPNNKQRTKLFQFAGAARFAYNWALNWIRLAEKARVPNNAKYKNPRISFDGENWWLGIGIIIERKFKSWQGLKFTQKIALVKEGVGIDLGVKDLAICSDKFKVRDINKTISVRKLKKKRRRLQRQVSKKYLLNKKGDSYCKTSNLIKSEKKLLRINHRLTNIRNNHIHQATAKIIKRKPSFICLEDLNIQGMMKNKHLSEAVQEQKLYEFRRQIEYKAARAGIPVIFADIYYPSSKTCICCGRIKHDLKLSDRTYVCECGNVIDRDYQAALNLKKYGETYSAKFVS